MNSKKVKTPIALINDRIRRKAMSELGSAAGSLFFSVAAMPAPGEGEGQMVSGCSILGDPTQIAIAITNAMTQSPAIAYIIHHAASYYIAQHVQTRLQTEIPPQEDTTAEPTQ